MCVFAVFIARRSLKLSVNSELSKRYNNLGNKNKGSTIFTTEALEPVTRLSCLGREGERRSLAKGKDRQTEDRKE